MKVKVLKNPVELGMKAAILSADILNQNIKEKGSARLLLSTGASQFEVLKSLVKMDVDWGKVEMFHLDEYINLNENHPASFRKYLKERFTSIIKLKKANFINGEGDISQNIDELASEIKKASIDIALVGIGENAHIAFNDPPADFNTKKAYIIVNLAEQCKKQQVSEGWFRTIEDVPNQAISMTVYQIMQSNIIISCVPYKVKANAVKITLENSVVNEKPATILKTHRDWTLFLDKESSSLVNMEMLKKYK